MGTLEDPSGFVTSILIASSTLFSFTAAILAFIYKKDKTPNDYPTLTYAFLLVSLMSGFFCILFSLLFPFAIGGTFKAHLWIVWIFMALQLGGIFVPLFIITIDAIQKLFHEVFISQGDSQIATGEALAESKEKDNPSNDIFERIEKRLTKLEKTNLPVALFASSVPVWAIGLANSIRDAANLKGIVWENLTYLFIGSLLVSIAMKLNNKLHNKGNKSVYITIFLSFGTPIIILIVNLLVG